MLQQTQQDIAAHKRIALKNAIQKGLLSIDQPLLALMDKQGIQTTIQKLNNAFPKDYLHFFAVKANPYLEFLKWLNQCGMGAEVASITELELAILAGFAPEKIIFDAPVKTYSEIDRAISLGIALNIDNFQELERINEWFEKNPESAKSALIGFRINPQVGAGSVESTSTATMTSKFGIGLKDQGNKEKIIKSCKKYAWLSCIHVHVGSVGIPLDLMCDGIEAAEKFANEINETLGTKQITHLDIGGGLPVDFTHDGDNPSFSEFSQLLEQRIPALFDGSYTVITEYGRAIAAKNAMTIGRVEYTKNMGGVPIASCHIGVQTLVRTVYDPEHWKRRISAFTADGDIKEGELSEQNIGGPACFSGDLIAHERALPSLEYGDYLMVHDTGSYHFSSHYQYNALPRIPIFFYSIDENKQVEFEKISAGQTTQDVINDYS